MTCLENQEFHHAVAGHSLLPHTLYPSSVLSKHFGNALQSYEFVISNTETLPSEQCEYGGSSIGLNHGMTMSF